ncbi:MAG TPA: HipA domain-containing protein [Actinomycetota bacterium]|nr:HipA domain-containing protein [Actinomycetota bacterium]
MAGKLSVWLYGMRVASIDQERGRLRLTYTEEALGRYPPGVPLLSLSLPLTPQRYTHGVVRPFLDGLLPEGEARRAAANDFNVLSEDTYGLVRALGRDCAGALVIQPDDEPAPPLPTTLTATRLSDSEIGELIANLRYAPLGVAGRVRITLAGVQEKLLLTRMPDGSWGRPVDGTPSTHILKPDITRFPNVVENEAFCMRLARNLGLPVAHVETATMGGRRVIVVERYDRIVHTDGSVERIHQEDFCQATGILPDKKYEEDGGPSLRRMAETLQAVAGPDSLELLLRAVTLNVLIGNGDAHGKNFSLLHDPSGVLRLAPLYDLISTMVYGDDRLAMYIDTVQRTDRVTAGRIINEAGRWGISESRAAEMVGDVLDRVPAAAEAARTEAETPPSDVTALVGSQVARLSV